MCGIMWSITLHGGVVAAAVVVVYFRIDSSSGGVVHNLKVVNIFSLFCPRCCSYNPVECMHTENGEPIH